MDRKNFTKIFTSFLLAVIFLLSASIPFPKDVSASEGSGGSGFDYFPMGESKIFDQAHMRAWFNYDNMQLGILPGTRVNFSRFQFDYSTAKVPYHFGEMDLYTLYARPVDIGPNYPFDPTQMQKLMVDATGNGKSCLGEGVNGFGNVVMPPECLITKNPIAGEVIEGTSTVYQNETSMTVIRNDFKWKYKTLYVGNWGAYQNCVWASLLEKGTTDWVYNYVYQKDQGLLDMWYGPVGSNGYVDGYAIFRVDQ